MVRLYDGRTARRRALDIHKGGDGNLCEERTGREAHRLSGEKERSGRIRRNSLISRSADDERGCRSRTGDANHAWDVHPEGSIGGHDKAVICLNDARTPGGDLADDTRYIDLGKQRSRCGGVLDAYKARYSNLR